MAVVLAEQLGNLGAAKLLDWPESSVRLYRKQLSGTEDFAKSCDETRAKIGARYYDLVDGAQDRLATLLNENRLQPRELIGLCSVATRAGNEVLGYGAPANVVNVQVNGASGELVERLGALAERLAGIAAGPVVEASCVVSEPLEPER